jgi:hypothetical protein
VDEEASTRGVKMAFKDWNLIWSDFYNTTWSKKLDAVRVEKLIGIAENKKWMVTLRLPNKKRQFNSKVEALKYAKAYMRTH